jgi:hypothetical protein
MMKRTFPVILAVVIALGALFPVILQAGTASACMGLTPGYWKNHVEAWQVCEPGDYFDDVFSCGPHATLLDVLNTGGGKFTALNRHAVAALLNSYAFPYPDFYTTADVIQMVQDAYSSGDWQSAKDTLEYANEYGD